MEATGRTPAKTAPWARPTASQSAASTRYMRVRTTCSGPAPASARAAVMISRQRAACACGSGSQEPSGQTGAVPATSTRSPTRSARLKPITGSKGDPDETRARPSATVVRPGPGEVDAQQDAPVPLHRAAIVVPVRVLAGDAAVVVHQRLHRLGQGHDRGRPLHLDPAPVAAVPVASVAAPVAAAGAEQQPGGERGPGSGQLEDRAAADRLLHRAP